MWSNGERCLYLLENFDLGLCLCSTVGIIPPTVDECLQILAVHHLSFVFTLQVSLPFGFCRIKLGEIANVHINKGKIGSILQLPFIIVKTTGMLMDNIRCNCIEERAIMRSEDWVSKRERNGAGTHTTTSVPGHVWR
jgi:hypothetical protein